MLRALFVTFQYLKNSMFCFVVEDSLYSEIGINPTVPLKPFLYLMYASNCVMAKS